MSYYKTCPECGAHLDPSELCDCTEKAAASAATPTTANNGTDIQSSDSSIPDNWEDFKNAAEEDKRLMVGCISVLSAMTALGEKDAAEGRPARSSWVFDCISSMIFKRKDALHAECYDMFLRAYKKGFQEGGDI